MLEELRRDARTATWLAGLENPTRTRRGFRLFTLPGDLTSDWIKLHGEHESGTEAFILDHLAPATAFIDVGANVGYFSLLAAAAGAARVVAFEPQGPLAALLRDSVQLNRFGDRVIVEAKAVANTAGIMRLTSCPGNTGHVQLVSLDDGDPATATTEVVVLDDWLGAHPIGPVSVCKIDTEGAEFTVLQGMAALMDRDRPAIVVEVIDDFLRGFGSGSAELVGALVARGYRDLTARYATPGDPNRYFVSATRSEAGTTAMPR